MAANFEIKGLKERVAAARSQIATLRLASADFETEAASLAADLALGTEQLKALHSDFLFDAQTLGNSPPPSAGPVNGGAVSAQPSENAALPEVK